MKYHNKISILLLTVIIFLNYRVKAQEKSYILGPTQSNVTKKYEARDYIKLQDGYKYTATTGNAMQATINENLLLNVDYLTGTNIPDPSTYTRDKNLKVGAINGNLSVSQTGAANYTVPISCPPGLGNMSPQVSIVYNSQGGNGIVGWGFNIAGISSINRVPQTVYNDRVANGLSLTKTDRFALDGNRLFASSTDVYGADGVRYYAEKEQFSNIVSYGDYGGNGPDYFVVTTKEGTVLKYGSNSGRLLYSNGTKQSVVRWFLDYMEDINGNSITYEYEQNDLNLYIKKITYGINKNISNKIENTIEFFYEIRSDKIPLYLDGLKGSINKVLNRIVTKTNNIIFRNYFFEYSSDVYSRLVKINESNTSGDKLNPTIFKWGAINSTPSLLNNTISVGSHSLSYSVTDQRWSTGDINNDGLTDLISCIDRDDKTVIQYYYASLNGNSLSFNTGSTFNSDILNADYYYRYYNKNTKSLNGIFQFGDFDGDGGKEFVIFRQNNETMGSDEFCEVPFKVLKNGTDIIMSDKYEIQSTCSRNEYDDESNETISTSQIPCIAIGDFQNDGYDDIIIVEKYNRSNFIIGKIFRSMPKTNIGKYSNIDEESSDRFFKTIYLGFSNIAEIKYLFLEDFNKDGLVDIILLTTTGINFYKNNGNINDPYPSTPDYICSTILTPYHEINSGHKNIIETGDFNGDGFKDFLINENGTSSWKVAYYNGDYTYTIKTLDNITARNDKDTNRDNDKDDFVITDINNDGKSDIIIFDADYKWDGASHKDFNNFTVYWYVANSNGTGFDLLKSITSNDQNQTLSRLRMFGDFNGDGRLDLINYGNDCFTGTEPTVTKWRMFSSPNINYNEGMLVSLSDGSGLNKTITYTPLSIKSNYSETSVGNPEKLNRIVGPFYLVNKVEENNGICNNSNTYYSYSDALSHHYLGFIGFNKTYVYNDLSNQNIVSEYKFKHELLPKTDPNDHTEYIIYPALKNQWLYIGNNLIKSSTKDYSTHKYLNAGLTTKYPIHRDKPYFLYESSSTITDNEGKNIIIVDNTYGNEGTNNPEGNLTQKVTTVQDLSKNILLTKTENYNNYSDRIIGDGNTIKNAPAEIECIIQRNGEASYSLKTTFGYNTKGQITSKVDFANKDYPVTNSFTYNIIGNPVVKEVSSSGLATRAKQISYDPTLRFAERTINELQQSTKAEYDIWGNVLTSFDVNNLPTIYTYDSWGDILEVQNPDNNKNISVTKFVNGQSGFPYGTEFYTEKYVDNKVVPNKIKVSAEYFDRTGRSIRKINYLSNGSALYNYAEFNGSGQVLKQIVTNNPGGTDKFITTYTYDTKNRLKTEKSPENLITTYNYNDAESVKKVTTTLSSGESFSKKYDATGQLIEATDPGGTIKYKYTSTGHVYNIEAPGGITQIEYDSYDRQKKLTDPNAGIITYEYNAYGELIKQIEPNGITIENTYDKLGRVLTNKVLPDNIVTTYEYDPENAIGQIKKISSNGKAPMEYEYDGLGRVKTEKRGSTNNQLSFQYEYDSKSRLKMLTYPSGLQLTYGYNSFDENTEIYQKTATSSKLIWKRDGINSKGAITKATYGNTKQVTYGFDSQNRLNSINVPGIINFSYDFNYKQQLVQRIENNFSEIFNYDNVNRLKKVYKNATSDLIMTYSNSSSNQNDRIVNKSDVGDYYYKSGNHQLDHVDMVKGQYLPKHELTYTPEKMTASIKEIRKDSTIKLANITYGVDNQRFSMDYSENSVLKYTRYYFNEYEKELDGSNNLKRQLNYIYSPTGLFAILEQTGTTEKMHYIYTDYLGSLRCITDENGTIEQQLSYDAWGKRRNPLTGAPFLTYPTNFLFARGYTGHEHLDEFGLINMNGRIYDPTLALFLSPDPYVQSPDFTQNFNRYGYCVNNPLMYKDSTGKFLQFIIGFVVGAAINYVSQVAANLNSGRTGSDAWFGHIDFFDVAVSGVAGSLTCGIGGKTILDATKLGVQLGVGLGASALQSSIDLYGNGDAKYIGGQGDHYKSFDQVTNEFIVNGAVNILTMKIYSLNVELPLSDLGDKVFVSAVNVVAGFIPGFGGNILLNDLNRNLPTTAPNILIPSLDPQTPGIPGFKK